MNQHSLIGKSKKEILAELGYECNYFPAQTWVYEIGRNFIGQKKFLILYFNKEVVEKTKMVRSFRTINQKI